MTFKETVTFSLLGLIVGAIILILTTFSLKYSQPIPGSPRNLTKKAPVFKKTYNQPSFKDCYAIGGNKVQENARIPILLYHYVEFVKDKKDKTRILMSIHPDYFEEQLKTLLLTNYTTVFVKEIPNILNGAPFGCMPAVALSFDDGYVDFYTNVFPILKKYQAKATIYIITNKIGKKDYLNEKQIRELIASGLVEIGSHTKDHVDLNETSVEQSRQQIKESKKILEDEFGIPIQTFSYPYGHYKQRDIDLVKEASYSAAVTVSEGLIHSKGDIYTLKRVRPEKLLNKDIIKKLDAYLK